MREILIRDLGKCINCDVCVDACRQRHGRARMTMSGPVFGQYQLPDVCRNCPDTPCVNACHLDGMHLHAGKTFVSEACRGCNKCVEACPYGVVVLLPRQHREREGFFKRVIAQARSWVNSVAFNARCESKHRGNGEGHLPKLVDGHVAADASRCVQCGVCGYNCPVGIQVRDYAREGKIVDDARCVKCGLCIEKCPRGTLRWDIQPEVPIPYFRADKCDLCRGYGESACVKECPTGAMLRLPADERIRELSADLYQEAIARYFEPGQASSAHSTPAASDGARIELYESVGQSRSPNGSRRPQG